MSSTEPSSTVHFPNLTSATPGEEFEVRYCNSQRPSPITCANTSTFNRQTATSEDFTPDPSKSIKLSPARQALVDDIIALYSCEPTVKRVERYTPDCVYDDQFVYANDRYKMAGQVSESKRGSPAEKRELMTNTLLYLQWFALPKLFNGSKNER